MSVFMKCRVILGALLSMALLVSVITPARAHEVMPTIADLSHDGPSVRLTLRLNAEAFLAGINLDGLSDTNESAENTSYDALRALTPDAFEAEVNQKFTQSFKGLQVFLDGNESPLSLADIQIEDPGDASLARTTLLTVETPLSEGIETIRVAWAKGYGSLVLRQQGTETPFTGLIEAGSSSPDIPLAGQAEAQSGLQAFLAYIPVGFDHILPKGLDHILFVLALFFLSTKLGTLLWQISAFTVAHTITLAAGALGWIVAPGSIVEPLIAASIAFVAVENLFHERLSRWRPLVIFGFGLLHGLGFASVLADFGLPEAQFIPALLGFNVGVEVGQLTVIALAFLAVGLWFGQKPWYRARIAIPASAIIALIGAYWVVERTLLA